MARAIDKRIMLDLIIEAKKTDPEAGPFSEWLAEYLVDHLPTLTPPNETPPCYQPDGDGCAYQCYDGQDEPIDKCKECPLCYSDKQRQHTPPNDPLTIEQLREMDGEPVYIISEFYHISEWNIPSGIGEIVIAYDVPCAGMKEVIPSIKFIDGKELVVEKYGSSWVAYHRPPEGEEDT